ncbi:Z1 domain-containing protein [Mucilaginibacter aquatilis]|uniref:Endonuclease n=1 Tax=Mucilaginibacter aquatilis TaxID=1517760 RepID=A0A6I4ICY5_9SPHI|nr:Z1 domain-containing protein [Mucilaginibacter aquatilis]MVN91456.1 endonuclease [Mucilaginibacter aquatilis]
MIKQAVKTALVMISRMPRPLSGEVIRSTAEKVIQILPVGADELAAEIKDILDNPDSLEEALRFARTDLPLTGSIDDARFEEVIDNVVCNPRFAGLGRDIIREELMSLYNIRMEDFKVLERNPKPWVYEKTASIRWNFWKRYSEYLLEQKGMPSAVVTQTDRLTSRILDGLFDPVLPGAITKYGLVVGQVQSGKTSNYTGLISKAADAGFNLIIVLAGTQNSLRSQTQLRIDEGFLGFDTQFQRAFDTGEHTIGAGINRQRLPVHSVTSSASGGDIGGSTTLTFHTNEPIIVVAKKTKPRLEKLVKWLSAQAEQRPDGKRVIRSKKMLLIDDEADQASINTNKEDDPATTTNRLIRDVIGLFEKSGYVGYTATPFANIFIPIEEDQLFPRDFIINLPAPSNYIGPDRVFGFSVLEDDGDSDSVLPVVRRINDYDTFIPDKHKKADLPIWKTNEAVEQNYITDFRGRAPESLKTAVKSFIITCAVRLLRGQSAVHNSMLIHITRFQNWQKLVFRVVDELLSYYKLGIEQNVPEIISELRAVFETDTDGNRSYITTTRTILANGLGKLDHHMQVHSWEDVVAVLHDAASRIQVREINGGSKDVLDYYEHKGGLSVIAIGGDKLSRGLTLEGLSVSYYLRASRMYDTLMQMGRWFGYRTGYTDLCRLFTSRDINEWFCHITHASEELRDEFDYMSNVAGATPEKYALKVRTHPGVLQISASNKIRKAVDITISWAGRLIESYELSKNRDTVLRNLEITTGFIESLGSSFNVRKDNYLWKDVSAGKVLEFLHGFRLSENLRAADPSNLIRFINLQLTNKELTSWNVALISKKTADPDKHTSMIGGAVSAGWYLRTADAMNTTSENYYLRKSHVISPRDEFIDLEDAEYLEAMKRTTAMWIDKNKEGAPQYPNGEIVRNEIRDPSTSLLMIYLLEPKGAFLKDEPATFSEPVVAFAISFPGSRFNSAVSYKIPEQLLPYFDQDFEFEQDEDDDDDN